MLFPLLLSYLFSSIFFLVPLIFFLRPFFLCLFMFIFSFIFHNSSSSSINRLKLLNFSTCQKVYVKIFVHASISLCFSPCFHHYFFVLQNDFVSFRKKYGYLYLKFVQFPYLLFSFISQTSLDILLDQLEAQIALQEVHHKLEFLTSKMEELVELLRSILRSLQIIYVGVGSFKFFFLSFLSQSFFGCNIGSHILDMLSFLILFIFFYFVFYLFFFLLGQFYLVKYLNFM